MLADTLTVAREFAAHNLPVVVGGAVAVIALLWLLASAARRGRGSLEVSMLLRHAAGQPAAGPADPAAGKSLNWAPPEASYADRRSTVRREGTPVRVLLASPTFRGGSADGFVVDRSTGGLRLAVSGAIAPGTIVQVKAANAPETIGYVSVVVRSCRRAADYYEAGCEFDRTPPWNVLLLFG